MIRTASHRLGTLACCTALLAALLACRSSKEKSGEAVEAKAQVAAKSKSAKANPFAKKVDPLTPSLITSRLQSKYKHKGYSLMKEEKLSGGGWIGTVLVGNKSSTSSDLAVYRVVLNDVASSSAGYALSSKLRKAAGRNPVDTMVGDKKLLVVTCVGYRRAHSAGAPGSCAGKNISGPRYVRKAITGG